MNLLNEHLKTRTLLCGYRVSIADVAVAAPLHNMFSFLLDEKFRNSVVNVTRWFSFISGQEEWKRSFGKIHFCVSPWSFDAN
jgi:glutathione S-transferase